jgi:hypothetical protein
LPVQGLLLAGSQTGLATDTGVSIIGNFRLSAFTLRIMAPDAIKGATLKKNHCPDSGAIIQGIPFDFQYDRFMTHAKISNGYACF